MKRVLPGPADGRARDHPPDLPFVLRRGHARLRAVLRPDREGAYFIGAYEDNDPSKRLLFIANYNNDVGEYWEFSDTGWTPIDLSNEAYKLGVNYIVYALTH